MTFKWTYGAAILLLAVAVVISVWDGGFWGASAHLYALGLVVLGGLFVLWGAFGRVPTRVERSDEPFTGYPKNEVMGTFDTRAAAANALQDLRRSGFAQDDLSVYANERGTARLDAEGDSHGYLEVSQRSLEHLLTDIDDLKGYESAVRRGAVVLGVLAHEEERREHVLDVFRRHHGYDIYYFGEMAVEHLDPDRARTRVD